MEQAQQAVLLEMPEQPAAERPADPANVSPKLKPVDREQTMLAQIYIEELIGPDHKARAIWELVGRLDLSAFAVALKTREGGVGRAAWNPRLLVSIWVYAYSEGIGSAREIERVMQWEPGLQWLSALEKINHHSLSDFRMQQRKALDDVFTQILGMLQNTGLLSLERVMHDGTKIRAQAGSDTFRREKTLREHLAEAQKVVEAMGDPQAEGERDRSTAARERAARERKQVLEQAMEEMKTLQEGLSEEERKTVRVSETEPEARRMKHGDNAIVPSYNAQITTSADHKIVVNAELTQCSSDAQSLMPALEQVTTRLQEQPGQAVVDGGFTNRATIQACAEKQIDLVGSLPAPEERSASAMKAAGIDPAFAPHQFRILTETKQLQCPAGCLLDYWRDSRKRDDVYQQYRARGEDCRVCEQRRKCCPRNAESGRVVSIRVAEQADVAAFRQRMKEPEMKEIYKQRGAVAEFPHAWIKEKLGLRKFHVRGMVKAGCELLWVCLTYNIQQYLRLSKTPAATA